MILDGLNLVADGGECGDLVVDGGLDVGEGGCLGVEGGGMAEEDLRELGELGGCPR